MSDECKKVRYRTKLDAKIALASTARKRTGAREENRFYFCKHCSAYHLTSRDKK